MLLMLAINLVGAVAQMTYPEECSGYAPPAVIKGNKIFVSTTGEYLPIKGINYYPRPNAGDLVLGNSQDQYTEEFRSSWERDIVQFRNLGINAVRLYAVDPGLNHDAFMCALKQAGIYVLVGLAADCKNCAVQWQDPPHCYPQNLKDRGRMIIREFARYENVLGFSAGNEIALSAASYIGNIPCGKKFLRDMRAYIKECVEAGGMRHIPVGMIFADHEREAKAKYYNCRSDPEDELENAEFVGINAYLHCDAFATDIDQLIGYKTLLAGVEQWGMTIPVMWTEFGCLNPDFAPEGEYLAQRNFLQVDALFSPKYREHFNGGFVFEYSTEKVYSEQQSPYPFTDFGYGNYGVGYFSPENCDHGETIPCEYIPKPEFHNLAARYKAVDTSDEVTLATYNPPPKELPACPDPDLIAPITKFSWPTDFDFLVASDRTFQCPALVPVYCRDVPAVCVTVPHPNAVTVPVTTQAPAALSTVKATNAPTEAPVVSTTSAADATPTTSPSMSADKSVAMSETPSLRPSSKPSASPTSATPSSSPTLEPTDDPTTALTTLAPSFAPTTVAPTEPPTQAPTTGDPTSLRPTDSPSSAPTSQPSDVPIIGPIPLDTGTSETELEENSAISKASTTKQGWLVVFAFGVGMILV